MSLVERLLAPRLRRWRELERTFPSAERLETVAVDGQHLELWRVKPAGTPKGAVFLLHGLAANRFAFHWPGRSLADYLASQGWDCFVGELRGAGELPLKARTFSFHDYLESDVPAFLEAVRRASGFAKVHGIGHSMGGILLLCHALEVNGAGLASVAALGSALDYSAGGSGFEGMLKLEPLIKRLPTVPWGPFVRVLSPVLGFRLDPIARFNFHPDNAGRDFVRAVYANVFSSMPVTLLESLISSMRPGGITARDGSPFLAPGRRLALPLLMAAASDDQQCPLPALESTARTLGAQVLRFGRAYGHRTEYGHFDLVLGRNAPDEVWPELARWLDRAS